MELPYMGVFGLGKPAIAFKIKVETIGHNLSS